MKTLSHKDMKIEMIRRQTRRASMLLAFKREGELTTKDLLRFGPGLSSRLYELRKDYTIMTMYEKPGEYRYIYMGPKEKEGASIGSVE